MLMTTLRLISSPNPQQVNNVLSEDKLNDNNNNNFAQDDSEHGNNVGPIDYTKYATTITEKPQIRVQSGAS